MTIASLLNGYLFIETFIIAIILCTPAPIFRLAALLSKPISKHLLHLTRRKQYTNQSHIKLLAHACKIMQLQAGMLIFITCYRLNFTVVLGMIL